MKKHKRQNSFSTSIPAIIDDIQLSQSKHTTAAKLKVFYKGATSDGRVFSEQFSFQLLSSLPGTPVVAFYDEEEGDFVGHAEKQSVFGYVPTDANVHFEFINGAEWAVTDVNLFTEREDIGSVAKQIIGKQHSLELDPWSIQYSVLEDEDPRGWVEFLSGSLIGLSVLGDNQQPAFSGSGFFTKDNHQVSLEQIVANYLALPKEIEVFHEGGKTKMFKDFIRSLFVEDEIKYLVENDRFVIYKVGDKVFINLKEDNELVNIDITEAFAAEPQEEVEEEAEAAEEEGVVEEPVVESEDSVEEEVPQTPVPEEIEIGEEQQQTEESGLEPQAAEVPANATALNDAEREELESYRRKDKEGIVNKYSKYLADSEKTTYINSLDSYTVKDLEKELSFTAMQKILAEQAAEEPTEQTVFTRTNWDGRSNAASSMDPLEAIVAHYKK